MQRPASLQDLILYGATVRFCFWMGDGFACEGGVKGFADVVGCFVAIGGVGGFDVIDSARVDKFTLWIDDVHLRGRFCLVELTDFTRGVEEDGGGRSIFIFGVGVGLGPCSVTLLSRGGGDNGEPDDPFRSVLFLKFLHVVARVVFFDEGAFGVKPLEDNKFARVGG